MLNKCVELKNNIENAILMFNQGELPKLFKDIPIDNNSSMQSYISEIEEYVLPQLDYIIECLRTNKKINKKKITFGRYIVHEWSNHSQLGYILLELENIILNNN